MVDAVRFVEDNITLVPVEFIPDSGKNFAVKIEPNEKAVRLRKNGLIMQMVFGMGVLFLHMGSLGAKRSGEVIAFRLIANIMSLQSNLILRRRSIQKC